MSETLIIDGEKIKAGIIYMEAMTDHEDIIRTCKKLGLNALVVPVRIDIESQTSTVMQVDSVTLTAAQQLIRRLNSIGIKVILEPFPHVDNGNVVETDYNPTSVDGFFWSWRETVLTTLINEIVKPLDIYALNISSNLVHLEHAAGYWDDIITWIRNQVDDVLITYRTNWWITATWDTGPGSTTEAYYRKLWNSTFIANLDFLSVSAYFELTDAPEPTLLDLRNAIRHVAKYDRGQNIHQEIYNFYTQYNVPIFFGEIGFASKKGAASEPWNHLYANPDDNYLQANLFTAYREVFEPEDWMLGIAVWQVTYANSTYYPMGKLAEKAIYNYYGDLYPEAGASRMMGEQLYRMMPNIHRRHDAEQLPSPYPMKRFFQVASVGLDYLRDKITDRMNMYDVDRTPAIFLPHLYQMMGFPFPNFLPESDQRAFLKVLPQLYMLKGTTKVFEYLGRTFYGDDSLLQAMRREGNKIVIDLHVFANGATDQLDKRTERFLYFAEYFRPVNRMLNVILTIFYDDTMQARVRESNDFGFITLTEVEEVYTKAMLDDERTVTLSELELDSYNKSGMKDDYHFDVLTQVVFDLEPYSKRPDDSIGSDFMDLPKNRLGRAARIGKFELGE